MNYFQVMPEALVGVWEVSDIHTVSGKVIDSAAFISGKRWEKECELILNVDQHGFPYDIGQALWGPIIAKEKIGLMLHEHFAKDLQVIPIDTNSEFSDSFVVVNVLNCIDCFDEDRVEFWGKYASEDGPKLCGRYKDYSSLKIVESRIRGEDLFWVKYTRELVVSENVKMLLKGKRGIEYWPV